ncbi:hypothetical protein EDC94DRAFT_632761 [Helicostylum pulchrum]|nr:hypothetical protein EDC94DRAFT_632761 [Helicostylum pulchrum]
MTTIFKAIRDNDIQLLNYYIDVSTGDHHNISKQDIQFIQQQLRHSGSKHCDLNKRSVNGRTALHCAVTWNRVKIAEALINCSSVNVNLRDRENGWTALHRALYMGNIEIARMLLTREEIDLSIKDWEGLDAFELYNSTIPDTFPKEQIQSKKPDNEFGSNDFDEQWQTYNIQHIEDEIKVGKGGTDLYTWGHNTNYVLGHADSENRVRPERVNLSLSSQQSSFIMTRPTFVIESIAMSKYHMAILTSEPQQNLLVCGFGRGGRLGTGKELDTQFTLIPVQCSERIASVALGRDHTIAITVSGNVLTFGQNNFGQLGYETENHESPMQLVPRKIQAQSLKKQPIIGAAASRIHSVVYTATDIFTFGYNQGQLGYYQPDTESCQTTPRKVSIMSTKIIQVVANDNATVILNDAHDIILLCNYNQQKIFLPVRRFPNSIQVHRFESNFATKLLSSGTEHLGALTNAGDVFLWTCRSANLRQPEQTQTKKSHSKTIVSAPKRIWTAHKPHLAAIDASIGQNGELIVCTMSGLVFIGRPESNGYKFTQVSSIQRCIKVCANSSGAFAAIRSEYQLNPIIDIPASTLSHDIISALPHIQVSNWLKTELQRHDVNEKVDMKRTLDRFCKHNSNQVESEDMAAYETEKSIVRQSYNQMRARSVDDAWKQVDVMAREDTTLDIVLAVEKRNIYCHSSILRCRSEVFKRLVKCKDRIVGGDIKIKLNKRESDGRIEIRIEQCQLASVLLLLDFTYTDEYSHPMTLNFQLPILSSSQKHTFTTKSIQKDLLSLAKIFHIPNLISTSQENYYRKTTSLQHDLKQLLEKQKGTDIVIRTKDDNDTKCHQVILAQRCPYFANMLQAGSVWVQSRREQSEGSIEANLDHMPKEIMDTIIKYIYMDQDESSLFNTIEKEREESMMYFLLDLLCESDALLLTRLKAITESALVRFIKLRSASIIFECADIYLAESLKKSCLQFISVNLPTFLSSSMLDSISTQLIRDLETYVRQSQIQETPTVPRGRFSFTADDSYLEVEDPEFSTSLYALSKGDGSVSSFLETLVTLRHEKRQQQQSSTKPSLREILENETQLHDSGSKSVKSSVPKKISQKERRKLIQKQELTTESSSSKPVWGKVAAVQVQPISESVATELPDQDRKGKKIYVAEEQIDQIGSSSSRYTNTTTEDQIKFNPIETFGPSFQMTPIRRLHFGHSTSNETKKSFQTIQKQQQLEDNWRKNFKPKKNITKIQKEEQAIESIAQYYVQTLDIMSGEWYEVHRLTS